MRRASHGPGSTSRRCGNSRVVHAYSARDLPADSLTPEVVAAHPDYRDARDAAGRLHMNAKNPRFWPAVGVALDVVHAVQARVGDAAELLGVSTGNLIDFLQTDPKVWQEANRLRTVSGQKPLRSS